MLVLSGCGIPQSARAAGAATHLPDSFIGVVDAENSAHIGTIEFFNDPKLSGLIEQGLAGNQNLRIMAQNIAIANNEVLRRRGAYFPSSLTGGPWRVWRNPATSRRREPIDAES